MKNIKVRLQKWQIRNHYKIEKYIFIGAMIALSIISTNFVIIAILLTALYLKK
jgi:hypothetical protein